MADAVFFWIFVKSTNITVRDDGVPDTLKNKNPQLWGFLRWKTCGYSNWCSLLTSVHNVGFSLDSSLLVYGRERNFKQASNRCIAVLHIQTPLGISCSDMPARASATIRWESLLYIHTVYFASNDYPLYILSLRLNGWKLKVIPFRLV